MTGDLAVNEEFSSTRRHALAAIAASALALAVLPAAAQSSWPNKPVRIVVPFAAGGTTDILARAIAPELSKAFGQQFIVDNRAGAGGNVGADIVAKSPADVQKKINDALKVALKDPEFIKKQEGLGAVVVTDKRIEPAEHKKFVAAEIAKWSPIIKAAGVYAD
jgi:tripartite-type tricarboxylate transporter receptor subunit TctC